MIKTAKELAKKAKEAATNYKTLYVMGCFGDPMTSDRKKYHLNGPYDYNKSPDRKQMIESASSDTFGFDCVCLIKGILWGWNGNLKDSHGGAVYQSNNVPDVDADVMMNLCADISTNFSHIEIGEALGMKGHIGIYIGDGLAVECTPSWKNKVQITAVGNIGTKSGYPTRTWTRHGKLPYVSYETGTANSDSDGTTREFSAVNSIYKSLGVAAIRDTPDRKAPTVSQRCIEDGIYVADQLYLPDENGQKWFRHADTKKFSALTDVDNSVLFRYLGTYKVKKANAPVNIRKTAGLNGVKLGKANKGDTVYCVNEMITKDNIKWVKVIYDNEFCWCDSQWLS